MLDIIFVILPIFALMGLGYLAVLKRLYPAEGVKSLIAFVNNFATPCLLFYSISTSDFRSAFNLSIIGPFYFGAIVCFITGIVIAQRVFGNRPGESVAVGFSGTFTNTVLVGLPILSRAYGGDALPVTLSIIGLHGAILLTLGMVTMELVRRDGQSLGKTLVVAVRRVVSNPLIWGIAAGIIGSLLNLQLIEPAEAFFSMMSQAVVPAALFGIGGALNEFKLSENWRQALVASLIKLILHPLLVWVVLSAVGDFGPSWTYAAMIMAALPPALNIFVISTQYNVGVERASACVLVGTLVSMVTLTVLLYLTTKTGALPYDLFP